jgi:mono/diheme cytochrome c family protein
MNKLGTVLLVAMASISAGQAFAADAATVEKGHQVYQNWCLPCHGPGLPGTIASEFHYKGAKPALLDQRTDLTAPVIKGLVRNGVFVMPRFRKTEVTDAELDAVAAYLTRNNKNAAKP